MSAHSEQVDTSSKTLDRSDLLILGLILLFGAVQLFLYQHSKDFLTEDVFYFDSAQSLIQRGFYGIQGRAETNQPPGLPAILAALCVLRVCSHAAFLRTMVVFETLGFLLAYLFLRNRVPRTVAAAICLLLISSGTYFTLATQWVYPCFPYFFVTMAVLFVASKLEHTPADGPQIWWKLLLAGLVACSLLLASAAMAFVGAMVMVTCVGFFREVRLGTARLKFYFAAFAFGVLVQGLWMHRKPAPLEWPLPGYPRPYLEQVLVKSGNYPELGMATAWDFCARFTANLLGQAEMLVQMIYTHWINTSWTSVWIMGPTLLILLGWAFSVLRTGGDLVDWYYAGYEFIYLLWPWKLESRFFLPVAPLACMYVWLGLRAGIGLARNRARLSGFAWFPIGAFLSVSSFSLAYGMWFGARLMHGGWQTRLSFAIWFCSAIVAALMAWTGSAPDSSPAVRQVLDWLARLWMLSRVSPRRLAEMAAVAAVLILVAQGLSAQLYLGRLNLISPVDPPDVQAGEWIRSHTSSGIVVMARQVPTLYHYSERQVVWFAPSSDPQLLMDGIRRLRADYLVVVIRKNPYYLPSDDESFASLSREYPNSFRMVFKAPELQIFQVIPNVTPVLRNEKSGHYMAIPASTDGK